MTAREGRQAQGAGTPVPRPASSVPAAGLPDYAELRCVSAFPTDIFAWPGFALQPARRASR